MIEIRPQPYQTRLLSSPADILICGGSAGSGKTWTLIAEPLRHIHNPRFSFVIFRRTFPQITNPGGLWDESCAVYPLIGGKPKESTLEWAFPSGASGRFAHLQHDKDRFDWQGSAIALLEWDELPHFTESQFWYLTSRNRSTCGVRPYVRASCNPDPDSFVADLIAWWINQETGYPIPERSGVLRWFVRINNELIWGDSRAELLEKYPLHPPTSLTFIGGKLQDNPILMQKDPGYLGKLLALPLVEQERLLGGNWKIRPSAGKVFNRAWFPLVEAVPGGGVECLFWDFAATEKALNKKDPDFTACVSIRMHPGKWAVTHCDAEQIGPAEVERRLVNVSRQRAEECRKSGTRFMVRWEMEGGSAGKREAPRYAALLAGLDAKAVRPQGDKMTRAKGLAAQAYVGNVSVLKAQWSERWLRHMHNQPEDPHDDIMDASSGAFNELTNATPTKATGRTA